MVKELLKHYLRCSGLLMALSVTFTGCLGVTSSHSEPMQDAKPIFYQFEPMREGEEIAEVSTTEGTFYLRFFPSEAPKAVSNFVTLAQEGFYDGKTVFSIQEGIDSDSGDYKSAFLAGASNEAGSKGKTIYHAASFRSEISKNVWHFPGAVSAYGTSLGRVDSRFFIVGSHTLDNAMIERMKKANFPEEVIEKFKEYGGEPNYSRLYPVFAQVYEGMDVVEKILNAECDEKGRPASEITIQSITISFYHIE